MEIDLNASLKTLEGRDILRAAEGADAPEGEPAPQKPWTMGQAAAEVMVRPQKDLTPAASLKAFMLAQKLTLGGTAELTSEEIHSIVQGATEVFAPLIAGQIILHFDPAMANPRA